MMYFKEICSWQFVKLKWGGREAVHIRIDYFFLIGDFWEKNLKYLQACRTLKQGMLGW